MNYTSHRYLIIFIPFSVCAVDVVVYHQSKRNMRGVTCVIVTLFCLKFATAKYLLVQLEKTDEIIVNNNQPLKDDNGEGTEKRHIIQTHTHILRYLC